MILIHSSAVFLKESASQFVVCFCSISGTVSRFIIGSWQDKLPISSLHHRQKFPQMYFNVPKVTNHKEMDFISFFIFIQKNLLWDSCCVMYLSCGPWNKWVVKAWSKSLWRLLTNWSTFVSEMFCSQDPLILLNIIDNPKEVVNILMYQLMWESKTKNFKCFLIGLKHSTTITC